jgi:hypothetical protein
MDEDPSQWEMGSMMGVARYIVLIQLGGLILLIEMMMNGRRAKARDCCGLCR